MRRRHFITGLASTTAAWPVAARGQQPSMPLIGFFSSRSAGDSTRMLNGFRAGLAEAGYVEGKTVTVEYRWADGRYDRLAPLAAELANLPIAVLVGVGAEPAARAAVAASTKIPVVTVFASDPVTSGLIGSLSHPGRNVTGVSALSASIEPKRIGLMHELLPQVAVFSALLNPKTPTFAEQRADIQKAAHALGLEIEVFEAADDHALDTTFKALGEKRTAALLVAADPFFLLRRAELAGFAARDRVPVMYAYRDITDAGGLMSYGIDLADAYRQMGNYAGRIIGGARPQDLPVVQPTKLEFVVNLKAAKALGLTVPARLLATADEVIE